jgi:hypothetical protein
MNNLKFPQAFSAFSPTFPLTANFMASHQSNNEFASRTSASSTNASSTIALRTPVPVVGTCSQKGTWSTSTAADCRKCIASSRDNFYCGGRCQNKYNLNGTCNTGALVAKTLAQCNAPCKQTANPPVNGGCGDDFDCNRGEKCVAADYFVPGKYDIDYKNNKYVPKKVPCRGICVAPGKTKSLIPLGQTCKADADCKSNNDKFYSDGKQWLTCNNGICSSKQCAPRK